MKILSYFESFIFCIEWHHDVLFVSSVYTLTDQLLLAVHYTGLYYTFTITISRIKCYFCSFLYFQRIFAEIVTVCILCCNKMGTPNISACRLVVYVKLLKYSFVVRWFTRVLSKINVRLNKYQVSFFWFKKI